MKKSISLFIFLCSILFLHAQGIVEEQSVSVCYMNDNARPTIVAITKAQAEIEKLSIEAYFDCSSPVSEPCDDATLGDYEPNSIRVGKQLIKLGGQLNGENVSRHNVGRFFYGKSKDNKYIVFEMADIDCPNVPNNYCYIIIALNSKNKVNKHILYNKEHNPMTEEELGRIINSLSTPQKEKKNEEENNI